MFNLLPQPRREPLSDWIAQVERIIARRHGEQVIFDRRNQALKACYDVGLSAVEIADDWASWKGSKRCF